MRPPKEVTAEAMDLHETIKEGGVAGRQSLGGSPPAGCGKVETSLEGRLRSTGREKGRRQQHGPRSTKLRQMRV